MVGANKHHRRFNQTSLVGARGGSNAIALLGPTAKAARTNSEAALDRQRRPLGPTAKPPWTDSAGRSDRQRSRLGPTAQAARTDSEAALDRQRRLLEPTSVRLLAPLLRHRR